MDIFLRKLFITKSIISLFRAFQVKVSLKVRNSHDNKCTLCTAEIRQQYGSLSPSLCILLHIKTDFLSYTYIFVGHHYWSLPIAVCHRQA